MEISLRETAETFGRFTLFLAQQTGGIGQDPQVGDGLGCRGKDRRQITQRRQA